MNDAPGSSQYYVSIVISKYIGHNMYTDRRINFCSKITPIHGPGNKSELKIIL